MHAQLKPIIRTAVFSLLLLPQISNADDLFLCEGKWTNKACAEGSTPVNTKRQISKVLASETKPAAQEANSRASLGNNAPAEDAACTPVPNGIRAKIVGLEVRTRNPGAIEKNLVQGTAYNTDIGDIIGPVEVYIKPIGNKLGQAVVREKIAYGLLAGKSTRFSVALPDQAASRSQRVDYEIGLTFSNPASCETHRVSNLDGHSSEGFGAGNFGDFRGTTSHNYTAQLKKELGAIEDSLIELN